MTTETKSPVIKVGGIEVNPVSNTTQRMSVLLWGPSGVGKTTLACTAPGKKLIVNFDPDGPVSIADFPNVDVADLSAVRSGIADQFKSQDNPLGLKTAVEHYDTIIIDSLTNAQHMAVMHAVSGLKGASIERPSLQGYGMRNALITQLVKNVLRLTGQHKKHVIFIAHEAAPQMNDNGVVIAITLALGGQLTVNAPVDFSECWHIEDTGKQRRIGIRPSRGFRPMKTRMFATTGNPEFLWDHTGTEMADWYSQWRNQSYKKIPLPK